MVIVTGLNGYTIHSSLSNGVVLFTDTRRRLLTYCVYYCDDGDEGKEENTNAKQNEIKTAGKLTPL